MNDSNNPDMKPFSVDALLSQKAPDNLGCLSFSYADIRFHVYGVLHGISGGMNAEYRDLLTRTVAEAAGTIFAEKGLFALLRDCRRPVSLSDWAVIRPWDGFFMGLRLTLLPASWRVVTVDLMREALCRHDRFPRSRQLRDLGGSPFFHRIDAWERRQMVGFPPPENGLRHDLELLSRPWRELWPRSPGTISPAWNRILMLVQRHGHIPARSLHMLNFAAEHARLTDSGEVSLFVGETHNTDMAWIAEHGKEFRQSLDQRLAVRYDRVVSRARRLAALAAAGSWQIVGRKTGYFLSLLVGATLGLALLMVVFLIFVVGWIHVSAKM
jgi:hypothetical protein